MPDIVIPSMGESIKEAVLGQWRKPDGSPVKKDEPLVDLETDKVTQELYATENGVLKIGVQPGATVAVGAIIGHIETNGAAASAAPAAPAAAAAMPAPASAIAPAPAPQGELPEHHPVSPLARKVADDLGIDVLGIHGTGPGGRVTKSDVEHWAADKSHGSVPAAPSADAPAKPAVPAAPAPKPAAPAPVVATGERAVAREPMTALRKRIAERLVEAQHTAAMLTTFNEVDCSAIMKLRKTYKEDFEKKHGVGLGFMSFFVAAACSALKNLPKVNAQIETDGNGKSEVIRFNYVDMGVAVSTERGLMVPVIRNAEKLSFAQIESAIKDLALRARDNKISVDELTGGTFTITNGGTFGSLLSTPILNPPQSAIMGMHKIQDRPVAVDGQVVIRPMMYLALSYDHRLVDGSEAVRFLVHIKERLEDPQRLLLGV